MEISLIAVVIIFLLFVVEYVLNRASEKINKNQSYTDIKDDPNTDNSLPF